MRYAGHLTLWYDEENELLYSSWQSQQQLMTAPPRPKRIGREHFERARKRFYAAWETVLDDTIHGKALDGQKLLEPARRELQLLLVPEGLFPTPPPEEELITATVSDSIPVEIFTVGQKPLAVRNPLLHNKLAATDNRLATMADDAERRTAGARASLELQPCAFLTCMDNVLTTVPPGVGEHGKQVSEFMTTLYGRANPPEDVWRLNPSVRFLTTKIWRADLACFYHLGHGIEDSGALQLFKEIKNEDGVKKVVYEELEAERLRGSLDLADGPRPTDGFAFVNACWSAWTGAANIADIAWALLDGGRKMVLGTILPPLDVHAAAFASELFGERLPNHSCDLVTSVFEARRASWQRYKCGEWQNHLSWAFYRLYGLPSRRFLRTRWTEDNGDIVLRTPTGAILLGSLEEDRPGHITAGQFQQLVRLLAELELGGASRPLGQMIRTFAGDERTKVVGHTIIAHVFQIDSPDLRQQVFSKAILDILDMARRTADANREALGVVHLCRATHLRICRQVEVPGINHALHLSNEVIEFLADTLVTAPNCEPESLDDTWLDKIEQLPRVGPTTVIDPLLNDVHIQPTLHLAWQMARLDNARQVRLIHMVEAIFIQGVLAEARGQQTGPEESLFPVPVIPKSWQLNMDVKVLLNNAGIAFLTDKKHRAFLLHLVGQLCLHDESILRKRMKDAGWNWKSIWQVIRQFIDADDARFTMPSLLLAGVALGAVRRELPRGAAGLWDGRLDDAAVALLKGDKPILIVMPWRSSLDNFPVSGGSLADALLDAVASRLAERVRDEPRIKHRHWIHLRAKELLHAPQTSRLLRFWTRQAGSPRRTVPRMLAEAKQHGVLCINSAEAWLDTQSNGFDRRVQHVIQTLGHRDWKEKVPAFTFLSYHAYVLRREMWEQFFDCFPLEPLGRVHLEDFLMELDEHRLVESNDQDYRAAIKAIVCDTQRLDPKSLSGDAVDLVDAFDRLKVYC